LLWKDEDWNPDDILRLLKFKLLRVKDEINRGYGDEKEWKEPRNSELNETIASIDLLLKDEFAGPEWEEHRNKYGRIQMETKPSSESEHLHEMIMYYDKIERDAEKQEQATDESMKIHNLEDERRQKEYEKMFGLMAKHIQGWWD